MPHPPIRGVARRHCSAPPEKRNGLREFGCAGCALTQIGPIVIGMKTIQSIRINVRGRLSNRLATALEAMTAVPSTGATELVGDVADQAQLRGVLSRIRDPGLDLESLTVGGPNDDGENTEA
jgi:hypothetical protein